jgi:hypothetical protein
MAGIGPRTPRPAGSISATAAPPSLPKASNSLEITAPCDQLGRLKEVVASHLVRFGDKDELSVVWQRDNS